MTEIASSIINKNNLLYGSTNEPAVATGPACIDRRGEECETVVAKPTEAPILAVREK